MDCNANSTYIYCWEDVHIWNNECLSCADADFKLRNVLVRAVKTIEILSSLAKHCRIFRTQFNTITPTRRIRIFPALRSKLLLEVKIPLCLTSDFYQNIGH